MHEVIVKNQNEMIVESKKTMDVDKAYAIMNFFMKKYSNKKDYSFHIIEC